MLGMDVWLSMDVWVGMDVEAWKKDNAKWSGNVLGRSEGGEGDVADGRWPMVVNRTNLRRLINLKQNQIKQQQHKVEVEVEVEWLEANGQHKDNK